MLFLFLNNITTKLQTSENQTIICRLTYHIKSIKSREKAVKILKFVYNHNCLI